MKRICFTLDEVLLKKLDSKIKKIEITNRASVIRMAIREWLEKNGKM